MIGKEERRQVCCPYCDMEMISVDLPYCQACGITTLSCPKCSESVPRNSKVCPQCGADIQEEVAKGGE